MNSPRVIIDGRTINREQPPYIIAELSANHNGDLDRALKMIEVAKDMGADAIKFQSYDADSLTIDCDSEEFQIHGGLWDGYNLYQLYDWAKTPFEWHEAMFEHARKVGITCFSTPFDERAVDLLEELKTPAYKIASFEATDLPLIKYVAQTGKPMIISTGMANMEEITETLDTIRDAGCSEIILLHCISAYPTPADESNLLTIADIEKRFNVVAGLSDHTLGTTVSVASVSLGARVIEKHFTLSRKEKGPDSEFSLEPDELKQLCQETKIAWSALGAAGYDLKPAESSNIKFRRSIYVVEDVKAGEKVTDENIKRIRPGYGLAPKHFEELIGVKFNVDVKRGTALKWEMLEIDK